MHGVKRLFSWMIPRFDRDRFNVSLVSLRKKDLSEETLEDLGIDISYLAPRRSSTRPPCPALLKIVDAKQIDVLHLHGYGATTFGRLAGAMRKHPDDPARARQPDRHAVVSEGCRPAARAVHRYRAGRVEVHRRLRRPRPQDPASKKSRSSTSGVPLEDFSRSASAAGDRRGAARTRHRPGRVRGRHRHPPARLEGQFVSRRRGCPRRRRTARHPVLSGRRGAAAGRSCRRRRRGSGLAIGSCSPDFSATWRARCRRSI